MHLTGWMIKVFEKQRHFLTFWNLILLFAILDLKNPIHYSKYILPSII